MAASLVAAGCGQSAPAEDVSVGTTTATTTDPSEAGTQVSSAAPETDGGVGEGSDEDGGPAVYNGIPFDLPFVEPDDWVVTTTSTAPTTTETTVPDSTGSTSQPPSTSGSGGAPVTTTGGGGEGDVSIYTGVLGKLARDEVVAAAAAPPPVAAPGTFPLTGLPGTAPARPAAVVKIDNGSRARPQSGLNSADIVVEEEVEGGITRFAAVFHSTPTIVGPIRSGRTTDIGIINGLGSPLFLYSGANQVTDLLLRSQPTVQNRNAGTSSGYWRQSGRRAPSNLYSDTAPHWASASGGPPPPQFAYRADGAPAGGADATSFSVNYRASKAAWTWDGAAWLRTQSGRSHMTASGQRVSAANVVVIEAAEVATGMVDSSGSTVPEFVFVGSGRAVVFTAGKRIEGTWTRPTLGSVATLTDGTGAVIELTPGRTWIELIGAGSGILAG